MGFFEKVKNTPANLQLVKNAAKDLHTGSKQAMQGEIGNWDAELEIEGFTKERHLEIRDKIIAATETKRDDQAPAKGKFNMTLSIANSPMGTTIDIINNFIAQSFKDQKVDVSAQEMFDKEVIILLNPADIDKLSEKIEKDIKKHSGKKVPRIFHSASIQKLLAKQIHGTKVAQNTLFSIDDRQKNGDHDYLVMVSVHGLTPDSREAISKALIELNGTDKGLIEDSFLIEGEINQVGGPFGAINLLNKNMVHVFNLINQQATLRMTSMLNDPKEYSSD